MNSSRGPVIDHDALYDALRSGQLFGADKMAEIAARNMLAGARGERLPAPVNPEVDDHAATTE